MTLDELKIGRAACIERIDADGDLLRCMLNLGFTPGARIAALHKGYGGYPVAYLIRGCVIALRKEEISRIVIGVDGDKDSGSRES